jgi:hypothetical protein
VSSKTAAGLSPTPLPSQVKVKHMPRLPPSQTPSQVKVNCLRKFYRWLIGASDDFNFDSEFARLIQIVPTAELRKSTRASEEAKWPSRPFVAKAELDTLGTTARKPKAPKRVANARPSAKSKTHKSRL